MWIPLYYYILYKKSIDLNLIITKIVTILQQFRLAELSSIKLRVFYNSFHMKNLGKFETN